MNHLQAPCHTNPTVMVLDAAAHHDPYPRHILLETLAGCHGFDPPMCLKRRIQQDGILGECFIGEPLIPASCLVPAALAGLMGARLA
jgi:hypothetical protein